MGCGSSVANDVPTNDLPSKPYDNPAQNQSNGGTTRESHTNQEQLGTGNNERTYTHPGAKEDKPSEILTDKEHKGDVSPGKDAKTEVKEEADVKTRADISSNADDTKTKQDALTADDKLKEDYVLGRDAQSEPGVIDEADDTNKTDTTFNQDDSKTADDTSSKESTSKLDDNSTTALQQDIRDSVDNTTTEIIASASQSDNALEDKQSKKKFDTLAADKEGVTEDTLRTDASSQELKEETTGHEHLTEESSFIKPTEAAAVKQKNNAILHVNKLSSSRSKTHDINNKKKSKKRPERPPEAMAVDLEEVKTGLICGDLRVTCPPSARIVRIFLSSTFTDTTVERNQLLARSYPRLKEVCKSRGYEFQLVDMRWGVGQAVANQHLTGDMCLREIELCQKLSTGPNFVTLLSHKYGYYAYPCKIETSLFESFIEALTEDSDSGQGDDDIAFMKERWFVLDQNSVPPQYILRPIDTYYPDFMSSDFTVYNLTRKKWNKECDRLVEILYRAARSVLGVEGASKFIKGVTDMEIEKGIVENPRRAETAFWLRREINHLDSSHKQISKYADTLNKESDWDRRNEELLTHLREGLRSTLPASNQLTFSVEWSDNAIDPTSNREHQEYIDKLCGEFERRIKNMFTKAADSQLELGDSLLEELAHHTALAQSKCEDFYGREDVLKSIKSYLLDNSKEKHKPLVIHGASGSGKTSVVAMTMKEAWEWREGKVAIVTRFIGASPDSSRVDSVLASMTTQIKLIYKKNSSETQDEDTRQEYSKSIYLATKERPLVILLDSFEQLDNQNEAMNLIPHPLPPNVKVVVSTLDKDSILKWSKECITHELKGFSVEDAMSTLKHWLEKEGRGLTQPQLEEVQTAFTQCNIPLYIRLALQETRKWRSFFPVEQTQLRATVKEAVHAFFERIETSHGKIFTSHTLGYLTLARRGLSENELEDILSCDDDVLNEIFSFWLPPIRRLPPLILVRLRTDLDLYIAQRDLDQAPVLLWNHQLFKDVAMEMFCKDVNRNRLLHNHLADFFSGLWAGRKKDFTDKKGPGSEDRHVTAQPILRGTQPNLRKLGNLPWHLANLESSQRLEEECLFNLEFLITKMEVSGIRAVIDDITDAIACFPEKKKTYKKIKQAIQISQKALRRDVHELPAQLLNRLMNKDDPDSNLKRLMENCRSLKFPMLICDQQILTPPGGELQHCLPTHSGRVMSLDMTNDGKTVVTCGDDRKVLVWDIPTGTQLLTIDTGDEPIKALLASNDQAIIVVTNHSLSSFGTGNGKLFRKRTFQDLHMDSTPAVCVAGRSKQKGIYMEKAFVVVVNETKIVKLGAKKFAEGDVSSKDISSLKIGKIGPHSHCFGNKDNIVVSDDSRYTISTFNVKTLAHGKTKRIYPPIFQGETIGQTIDGMCFSGDEKGLLVSTYRETDILLLHLETLEEDTTIKDVGDIEKKDFRLIKDEATLYFPSGNDVIIQDMITSDKKVLAKHPCDVLFSVTIDLNPLVTIGRDSNLRIWNYGGGKLEWIKQTSQNREPCSIRTLSLFRTNHRYALALKVAADMSREVIVQDLLNGKTVRRGTLHHNVEMEVYEEEPANVTAIIRRPSGRLSILDLDQMKVTHDLEILTPELHNLLKRSFKLVKSRDEILCIGARLDTLIVYSLRNNRVKDEIDCEKGDIENFKVDDRDSLLAIATEEGVCVLYDLETNKRLYTISMDQLVDDPDDDFLKVICVTSDGKYVVLEILGFIKVWNVKKKRIANDLEIYLDTEELIEIENAISVPGNKLLTSDEGGKIRLFDIKTGKIINESSLHHPREDVYLSASQSDSYLTYGDGGRDQTIAVWSSEKALPVPVATFTSDTELDQVTISHDGKFVVGCLRNPARIVTWHLQDGNISRDKSMDGDELFKTDVPVSVELCLEEEQGRRQDGFTTEEDPDSEDEEPLTLKDTFPGSDPQGEEVV